MHRQRPGARGRERSECAGALGRRRVFDPDVADHLLNPRYRAGVLGDEFELAVVAGDADQIDRAVDRFDVVIDAANFLVERDPATEASRDPDVGGVIDEVRGVGHLNLVDDFLDARRLPRQSYGLDAVLRFADASGQEHAAFDRFDVDIEEQALVDHVRIKLDPDSAFDHRVVDGGADRTSLRDRHPAGGGGRSRDHGRAGAEEQRGHENNQEDEGVFGGGAT